MRHDRRRALTRLIGLLGLPIVAQGHTPFRQWVVYRRKHLLIGADKQQPGSYALAKRCVEHLAERLPEAHARVARAPSAERLASLVTTGQLPIVLLDTPTAHALRDGTGTMSAYGPFDAQVLLAIDAFVLLCAPDFPPKHAWLVVEALTGAQPRWATRTRERSALPLHSGSAAFLSGAPMPALDDPRAEPEPLEHRH